MRERRGASGTRMGTKNISVETSPDEERSKGFEDPEVRKDIRFRAFPLPFLYIAFRMRSSLLMRRSIDVSWSWAS